MLLSYFALVLLIFVAITIFYGVIVIHDIPYEIAKKRHHPHQDAIHIAGWISLFTLHTIWPFLWIWSTLYREDRGWGFNAGSTSKDPYTSIQSEINQLKESLAQLQTSTQTIQANQEIAIEPSGDIRQEPPKDYPSQADDELIESNDTIDKGGKG